MNGLYPIIRRVRRPFVIQDDDSGPPPAPPPVPLVQPAETVNYTKLKPLAGKKQDAAASATQAKK